VQAVARSAFQESMNQLNAALGLLDTLAPGPTRDDQELALRMALLMPMMATRGFTGEEDSKVNLERALALSRGIGDTVTIVRALAGLFNIYFIAGKLRTAREVSEQMIENAGRNPDEITTYLANQALATAVSWMGELRCARYHLERALAIDEKTNSAVGGGGRPPISVTINVLSYVLWMLGYPDQVLRELARMASPLSRPVNLYERAAMIQSLLLTRSHFLRDYHGMRPQAEAGLALARENGFTMFVGPRIGPAWPHPGGGKKIR
jgi:hypothetical protein